MLSRRTVIVGGLAASASFRPVAQAQNPPAATPDGNTAPRTILQLQRRNIEVNGKPASVFDIRQPDGTFGITTDVGKPFRVRVENRIDEPSLIHWHGLTPPWQQDGVPGISGPAIPPGGSAEYDFPLRFGGTFWMHSHQGLQEQLLMAEPLIIRDQRDRPDQQEVVVMLADFSFTPPDQIFADLKKGVGMTMPTASGGAAPASAKGSMAGMPKAAAAAKPDLNDVKYDAFLANDRTLADPQVIKVEPGGRVLLRIINSSSMSAYHIDLGPLEGELIAVDGFPVTPVTAQLPDRGCATPRHSRGRPACAGGASSARRAGGRAQTNRHHIGRWKRGGRPYTGAGQDALGGALARSGGPPARNTATDPAQGRPRSYAKSDRRDGGVCLVDQQRRMEPECPAIASGQWRACRACYGEPDTDVASDASARP
jgi:hypothetical protein